MTGDLLFFHLALMGVVGAMLWLLTSLRPIRPFFQGCLIGLGILAVASLLAGWP